METEFTEISDRSKINNLEIEQDAPLISTGNLVAQTKMFFNEDCF